MQEISIDNIVEQLPCESIPDTRALQRIRLETVGKLDWSEKQIKKYKDEAQEPYKNHFLHLWNEPRIARLSEEDQRKIYSLAIPLTFPLGDSSAYNQDKKIETNFSRFHGHFCGNNALHLTTKEGFNELVKILVNNNIPIELGDTWQIWTPFRKLSREYPAVKVPFKFCEQKLLYHSFVTPEQDVMACPFWYVEELGLSHNIDEIIRTFLAQADEKRYYVDSHFFSRKHYKTQPEQYIPEYIEERTKSKIGEAFRCGGVDWTIEDAASEILEIGEPVEVYDPSWIKV